MGALKQATCEASCRVDTIRAHLSRLVSRGQLTCMASNRIVQPRCARGSVASFIEQDEHTSITVRALSNKSAVV